MKVLVVGLNPSRQHGKSPTLRNLYNWLDRLNISFVSFTNLYEGYTATPGSEKTEYIARISQEYDKVICLGATVSTALRGMDIDHFRMPHPSGRNRLLNDQRFVDQQISACKNYLYGGRDVL